MEDERYAFEVEWFDAQAELMRRYIFTYFVRHSGTNEIEMYDLKTGKKFLKRCAYPSIKEADLYIGAKIVVYARQLKVVEYADERTRRHFEQRKGHGFILIKPEACRHAGTITSQLSDAGFTIANLRMLKLSGEDAEALCGRGAGDVTSDVSIAVEVVGDDCIAKLNGLAGPEDPGEARSTAPRSIRAMYGTDGRANAVFVSSSPEAANTAIDLVFGSRRLDSARRPTATFDNCTCAVIKPHAVREGTAGSVLAAIQQQGFEVSAAQLFYLDKSAAEEFLEVYKGVIREYSAMVDELCSGPCIALEVRAEDAVPTFRAFVGPYDVEVGQHIRPSTLRAKFGHDRVRNAVHCTDLPEDGRLECEYFFHILQQVYG